MADISFEDILNMPMEDAKPPQALPPGTYLTIVDGQPEFAKLGANQTDCVNFTLKPMHAGQDVDQKQLKEALDGQALQDKKIRHRLFITNESKHRLRKFLQDDLGISKELPFRQAIMESMGKQVYVKLTHQASQDGTTIYNNVQSTARV